jgi:ribosomal protein L35
LHSRARAPLTARGAARRQTLLGQTQLESHAARRSHAEEVAHKNEQIRAFRDEAAPAPPRPSTLPPR